MSAQADEKPPTTDRLRTRSLQGLSLYTLCFLSANIILFALGLPVAGDAPFRRFYQYGTVQHYMAELGSSGSDQDPTAMFRGFKVMPAFVGLRAADGSFHLARRLRDGPILYYGFHVLPAIIWSVAMPIQHVKRVRFKYASIHRYSGYIALVCSLVLSVSGLIIPRKGLTFRHPDYFHIHILRVRGVPVLAWPNFALQTDLLAPLALWTGYQTIKHARARRFAAHRYWAQLHTYATYLVPMQRIWMYVIFLIGVALPLLPDQVLRLVHYPVTDQEISSAELGGFAITVFFTFLSGSLILHRDYSLSQSKSKRA